MVIGQLLQDAGYAVTQAQNGETALDLLEDRAFDVVLTDIVMGEVGGIEVLHAAKKQPYQPVVLLLTGYGTLETCRAALRMGAHNYLLKPCPDRELLESIEEAIHHRAKKLEIRQAIETLNTMFCQFAAWEPIPEHMHLDNESYEDDTQGQRVGELFIGNSRSHVYLQGSQIHVTPIEFAFLRFLANTPGKVCHYHTIIQHTHNITSDYIDARDLLRPHARNIHRKIGIGYLVHERGIGYLLVDPTP
jgi:DNA-binding response OmpR family regulator